MLLPLDNIFNHKDQSVAWGSTGQGEPVIMIHGFPWSAQSWRKIVPWLAQKKTVYYFDMIGCGQSEKKENQTVSPDVQNDLLAALIDYWNLDSPEVIAHDFGGLAALRGYYVNKLRYRKLTLMDVVAVLPSGSAFYRHVREHVSAFTELPGYAHEALFNAYIQNASAKKLSKQVVQMYASPWLGIDGQKAFYRQISQSDAKYIDEVQSQYAPMSQPVNIIWAENDTFIPISQGQELAKLLNVNTITKVPQAGHVIQEDAPEAVIAALLLSS